MAKKSKTASKKPAAKKPAKKPPAKKPAKASAKSATKAAPKKKAPVKAAKRVAPASTTFEPGGPFPVSTGEGAKPLELCTKLIACFNEGREEDVWNNLWSSHVVSCEGYGAEMEWRGREAVIGKNKGWSDNHIIHGARAEGPYVGASGFAVRFEMDVEEKATGNRWRMTEIGVYTVKNGRITREEFMYGARERIAGA